MVFQLNPTARLRKSRGTSPKKHGILYYAKWCSIWGATALVTCGLLSWWILSSFFLPTYEKWAEEFDLERINDLNHPTIIYDRYEREMGRIFVDESRSYVKLEQISPTMINALIAQEDSRFREHPGYDIWGIIRASKEYLSTKGAPTQGASSITQQLARNAYDLKDRALERGEGGIGRKLVELYLAKRITNRYSKDQVLEFYLNRVYLGHGFYGIRAASLGYFGKEPMELTTRESASIAALIKNPVHTNPIDKPQENTKWRNHVLNRMAVEGYITQNEADQIKLLPLGVNPKPLERNISHVYEIVRSEAASFVDKKKIPISGLKIYTTFDKDLQTVTEDSLRAQLDAIENRKDFTHEKMASVKARTPSGSSNVSPYLDGTALIVDNESGGILAYVGGRNFSLRNFDAIQNGARAVGTSLLPLLYATAFENGYSPINKIPDEPIDNRLAGIGGMEGILGEWGMEMPTTQYEGAVSLRTALSKSKIAASLRLGMDMGANKFVQKMKALGLRVPNRSTTAAGEVYLPRIFVGVEPSSMKEMVMAYTAIPNKGTRPAALHCIERIAYENDDIIYENPSVMGSKKQIKVLDAGAAFQTHSILKNSVNEGSAQRLRQSVPESFMGGIQTGTNYDFADTWLFAYNNHLTCGIWVGFLEGKKSIYPNAFSTDTCGPILKAVLEEVEKQFPSADISMPDEIDAVEICTVSGQRATTNCYERDPRSSDSAPKYIQCVCTEYQRKGDISLPACEAHSGGKPLFTVEPDHTQRTLDVIPILPKKPTLLGNDPYGTEQNLTSEDRRKELLKSVGKANDNDIATPEIKVEEELTVEEAEDDSSIPLPAPAKSIPITIPPLQSL